MNVPFVFLYECTRISIRLLVNWTFYNGHTRFETSATSETPTSIGDQVSVGDRYNSISTPEYAEKRTSRDSVLKSHIDHEDSWTQEQINLREG